MQRARVGMAGLVSALLVGCVPSPMMWSPDGKWLAYTTALRPADRVLAPGWLFEVGSAPEAVGLGPSLGRPRGGMIYRLWATRAEDGASVLLEESRGPLTSPGWNPDGSALAFGRLVAEPSGEGRFEVVVQEAPSRRRVLYTEALTGFKSEAEGLPGLAVSWSPDGQHLAVPQWQPLGLAVLRADTGRALKTVAGGFFPSWSPDGSKLAFYISGAPEGLYCLDAAFGAPRHLADVAQPDQPPAWAPDGQSLLFIRKAAPALGPLPPAPQAELIRVFVETGKVVTVHRLEHDPVDRDQAFLGTSFSLDRGGESVFYTTSIAGQPSQITWHLLRNQSNPKRFPLLDSSMPLGALAVSPAGRLLALRIGPPDILSPPALCDPTAEAETLTLLAPDDAARAEWIATLVTAARTIVREQIAPPTASGLLVERATLLPVPGEMADNDPAASRLRHLGRLGRPLCDRPDDAPPPAAAMQALLDEARLFFDYLRADYPAARQALGAVEARTTDPDRLLKLLGVRAQIDLGLGELDRAQATIAYINAVQPRREGRVEAVPDGLVRIPEPDPGAGWPAFLAEKADALARSTAGDGRELAPLGRLPDLAAQDLVREPADLMMPGLVAPAEPPPAPPDVIPVPLPPLPPGALPR